MIRIHPIEPDALDVFAAVLTPSDRIVDIRRYVSDLCAKGAMRPEWCFLAERDGKAVGRCAFWALPGAAHPRSIVLLDAPWGTTDAAPVGDALLGTLLRFARSHGCPALDHVIDRPAQMPQWQDEPEARRALLERHGFSLARETARFERQPDGRPMQAVSDADLRFRTYAEVGEATFVAAIAAVSEASLDRQTRARRQEIGAEAEAAETLTDLREMTFDPAWWELAYAPDGTLAGLVMPTKAPTFATIGYIGVVPAMRGRGLVRSLLARGTSTLERAGAPLIRTDTDLANAPMAAAFRALGYRQFATRQELRIRFTA